MNFPCSTLSSSELSEEWFAPSSDIVSSCVVGAEPVSLASGQCPIDDGGGLCKRCFSQKSTDDDDDDNSDGDDDDDE